MRVTSVEKWRGMESEVLLWLVDGGYYTGSMMDSCTKVTVKMVVAGLRCGRDKMG